MRNEIHWNRPSLRDSCIGSLLFPIFVQFRKNLLDVLDAGGIAGVGAHELGNGCASCRHLLPEGDGDIGIVTGHGHKDETHVVGFCFMLERKGERDTVLGAETINGAAGLLDGC